MFEDVRAILTYSAGILKKYKANLHIVLFLKILTFPLGLSVVYITKATLDKGIFAKNLDMFLRFLALGMAVFFLTQALRYLSDKRVQEVRAKFSVDVNYGLTDRLFGLDYLRIKQLSSAEHAFILDHDYHICEKIVFDDVPSVVSVLKIPVFFALAFMLSWPLTLLVLVTLPFMVLHTIWASRKRKEYKTRQLSNSRKYYSTFLDFLRNIKLIKSFAKEEWALGRIMTLFQKKIERALSSSLFSNKSRLIKGLFLKTSAGVFLLVGGYLIIKGRMTFGSFSAVSMYMAFITSEAYNLSSFVQGLNEDRVSIMRSAAFIREITEKRKEAFPARVIEGPEFGRDIAFQNISFGYTKDRALFKDMSLVIPAGKWTLIRGESGVGKTTLLSLFLRLFPSCEGRIFIGESNVEGIDRNNFFRNISVVHQEPYLFDDTLINNVLMGKDRDIRDIEKALRCTRLGELAGELFSGYNSRIGESGSTLSGGQKQRVAIARALAREPKILVFDEATSFLDSNMEEDIFRDIKKSFPSLTVIFVTHRDTAKKFADEIFILEDGGILRGDSYGEGLSGKES